MTTLSSYAPSDRPRFLLTSSLTLLGSSSVYLLIPSPMTSLGVGLSALFVLGSLVLESGERNSKTLEVLRDRIDLDRSTVDRVGGALLQSPWAVELRRLALLRAAVSSELMQVFLDLAIRELSEEFATNQENGFRLTPRRYGLFLQSIFPDGSLYAVTRPQFWSSDSGGIGEYMEFHRSAVQRGVKVRRLFEITRKDMKRPWLLAVLADQAALVHAAEPGQVEIRCVLVESEDLTGQDFACYARNEAIGVEAVAIASFSPTGDQLEANYGSFDRELAREKKRIFDAKFHAPGTQELTEFLKSFPAIRN